MARKTEIFEEQAARAPWRGTVDGRPACIACFRGRWEISCRVDRGRVMFKLENRAAIRKLADAADPPIPEKLLRRMLKRASRDEPVGGRARKAGGFRGRTLLLALLVVALAAAAALLHPGIRHALRR